MLLSALCAGSYVSAASNVEQSISAMNTLADKIGPARSSLDNYNGGILASLGVAQFLMIAQTAARTARENLAKENNMTPEEGARYSKSYDHVSQVVLGLLEDQAKAKVPEETYRKIQSSFNKISAGFDQADRAFQ
ncbi:hypothetical protein N7490_001363 [Penicillium lividum]|nr:hypothetical protein N7490_001363 [Penicillium lividum]